MPHPLRSLAPRVLAAGLALAALGTGTAAACQNSGSFSAWLQGFRKEAAAAGISQRTIDAALGNVAYDERVISRDRRQSVFSQSFLEFSDRMVAQYRIDTGRNKLRQYASAFAAIERQYGVPGPVISTYWALETDFGANLGDFRTLNALATLAYDCRRPEKFRPQLLAALKIIERGDLQPGEMVGAWAGELGQTQILPSEYERSAVDADGDGKRNLIRSVPDVLASTANILAHYGWRRGEPWLEEVRVPADMPWEEAALDIKHPRSQWARWGVTRPGGAALPSDGVRASLLLPMGRLGPAFLAYPNFDVFLEWNNSYVYSLTAAYLATRLAGAPKVGRGNGTPAALSFNEIRELQNRLNQVGVDVGGADGIIGEKTRAGVRVVQKRLGLPIDGYPTKDFLAALRRGG